MEKIADGFLRLVGSFNQTEANAFKKRLYFWLPNNLPLKMKISVVIPIYNAARFLSEAIRSALDQPEVEEVILVDDGSIDDSFTLCEKYALKYSKIRLFQHPDKKQKGAGAARNLGICKARCDYVTFLDADDFFLPGRFRSTKRTFREYPDADGVYEAVGTYFETEQLRKRWLETGAPLITTVRYPFAPEDLFFFQAPIGAGGYCPTNGWTVKRSIFEKSGLFDVDLPLHQDTALFMRFAMSGRIYSGEIVRAVAMRRVHGNNRSTFSNRSKSRFLNRVLMWEKTRLWAKQNGYEGEARTLLYMLLRNCEKPELDWETCSGWGGTVLRYCNAVQKCPRLLLEIGTYCYFIKRHVCLN